MCGKSYGFYILYRNNADIPFSRAYLASLVQSLYKLVLADGAFTCEEKKDKRQKYTHTHWRSLQIGTHKMCHCLEKTSIAFLTKPEKDLYKRSTWLWIDLSSRAGLRQHHAWQDQAWSQNTVKSRHASMFQKKTAYSLQTFQFQTDEPPFISSRLWFCKEKQCLHSSREQNLTQVP